RCSFSMEIVAPPGANSSARTPAARLLPALAHAVSARTWRNRLRSRRENWTNPTGHKRPAHPLRPTKHGEGSVSFGNLELVLSDNCLQGKDFYRGKSRAPYKALSNSSTIHSSLPPTD